MILAQRGIVLGRLAAKVARSHVHAANGLLRCEELHLDKGKDKDKEEHGHDRMKVKVKVEVKRVVPQAES